MRICVIGEGGGEEGVGNIDFGIRYDGSFYWYT